MTVKLPLDENLKKELLETISPLIKEMNTSYCFGWQFVAGCNCSGNDVNTHFQKQTYRFNLEKQVLKIVSEKIGEDVFRFPGTYNEFCICLTSSVTRNSAKPVLVIAPDGTEEKEMKTWY
jgi:hypothetical protein